MAGDVVGQVPDEFYSRLREQPAHIELEGVTVNDFQRRARESFPHKFHEPSVLFDREHARARIENEFGESTEARADFDDVIVWRQIGFLDDPAREVTIVQKILPESFYRRDPDFAQRGVNFRELHRRRSGAWRELEKRVSLFTKNCEQNAPYRGFYSQLISSPRGSPPGS